MRHIFISMLALLLATGIAFGAEPFELSGKDFADIDMFNGTDMKISEDLAGTSASMMGIDTSFLADNEEDGKPINQSKPVLALGSMTGYDKTAWYSETVFYTPAELEQLKNTSTWLEILP